jgi:hypothetical protein
MRGLMSITISALGLFGNLSRAAEEPLRHPYQVFAAAQCLDNSCPIDFPAITSSRPLVTKISCRTLAQASGGVITFAELEIRDPVEDVAASYFQPFAYSAGFGPTFFGINGDPYAFLNVGQNARVFLTVDGAAFVFLECSLSGHSL